MNGDIVVDDEKCIVYQDIDAIVRVKFSGNVLLPVNSIVFQEFVKTILLEDIGN